MTKDDFAIRLHEARRMMKFSMEKLSELTGKAITKQSISQYEKGIMRPKRDALQALAHALNISGKYFSDNCLNIDMPMLRTSTGIQVTDEEIISIEARLSFWAEQYLKKETEANNRVTFVNPLQGTTVSTLEDAIQAADLLRKQWNCGEGPLPFLLRLFERKGVKILFTDLPKGILGLSTWADKRHPLIALDTSREKTTTERIRFTAAHELAHLLLTFPKAELSTEKRCHKFASFFLFPRHTFIEEMGGNHREEITLEEMTDLRELYGVSIAAQVHEAWDIGMISREHYDWWYNEKIHKNPKETGWGRYPFPETIGREKRIEAIVHSVNSSPKEKRE